MLGLGCLTDALSVPLRVCILPMLVAMRGGVFSVAITCGTVSVVSGAISLIQIASVCDEQKPNFVERRTWVA